MRFSARGTRLCAIASLISLCTGPSARADFDIDAVDALVTDALKSWSVPGAAVVIVGPEKIIYLKGYGVRKVGDNEPVTPDTVFPLASCSKAFTTTLMAQLVDDGVIAWDDPVRKHLPYFHLSDPNADALVTLRDLVSHRTGVAPHDLLWYRAPWSLEEMIRRTGRLPLSHGFRTTMQYQSVMVTAAGQAAARAAGKPWAELIRERLFLPLGMKSASVRTVDALAGADHATGHRPDSEGKPKPVKWYTIDEPNPAGSVNASARDLAGWLQLHLNEGTYQGKRLVSADQIGATHSPQIVIPLAGGNQLEHPESQQMSYGMGWVIQDYRGELLVSHAGIIDGFRAHLTLLPKRKLALAVLANSHATRMNLALSNQIVDRLLGVPAKNWDGLYHKLVADDTEATKKLARQVEADRVKGTTPTLSLGDYVGTYENEAYGSASIKLDDGRLVWEWSTFRCPLKHYHYDMFRLSDEPLFPLEGLEFQVRDKSPRALKVLGQVFRRVEPRR